MHMTIVEARVLARELAGRATEFGGCQVVLCPPFTSIQAVAESVAGSGIQVGAQDVYWEAKGAYTGEVSCEMLIDAGCRWVIIGHSERRAMFGETDDTVNRKTKAALAADLLPIVCVGESLAQREQGITAEIVSKQVERAFVGVPAAKAGQVVVAYEPIWAIGTGRAATGEDANEVAGAIRRALSRLYCDRVSEAVRIQYGGSVKPSNMAEFARQPDIDGALVGGASLAAEDLAGIVGATASARK